MGSLDCSLIPWWSRPKQRVVAMISSVYAFIWEGLGRLGYWWWNWFGDGYRACEKSTVIH